MQQTDYYKYAVVAGCLAIALGGKAQRTMTLQECLRTAEAHNPDLTAGRLEVEKSEMLEKTAVDLEKTSLSLSQDLTSGGSSENAWSVSQSFDFPTVYSARRNALKSGSRLKRAGLEVARRDLEKEVTSAYYTLLYNRDVMKIYEEQDTIYGKFLQLASVKYKMGDAGPLEKMNAERLYRENKLARLQVEKDFRESQLTLQRWMGIDEFVIPADSAFSIISSPQPDNAPEFGGTPWSEVYERQRELDERNLTTEKRGFLPGFSVSLTSQLVLKGLNPYNVDRSRFDKGNFMGFEVGISFPLFWGAQKARVKAAKQEIALNKVRAQQAEYRFKNEYRQAFNEYVRARKDLTFYKTEGNPEAGRMLDISRLSYEKGEIGYVEYIQNLQTVSEMHLQYAKALDNYNQSVIMLNYLKGK